MSHGEIVRILYILGGALIGLGTGILVGTEIYAAWVLHDTGDTISGIVWSWHVPGFLIASAAVGLAGFILALAGHFIARGWSGL